MPPGCWLDGWPLKSIFSKVNEVRYDRFLARQQHREMVSAAADRIVEVHADAIERLGR